MKKIISWLDKIFYPNYENNWDNWMFREYLLKYINPESKILDFGAGRGMLEAMNFKGLVKFVAGVDPDQAVLENRNLDEAKLLKHDNEIPYEDNFFDFVISNNVLEHVDQPEKVFTEINRVLKPGGRFIAKTPNKWYYVSLIARFTPHVFHEWINKKRGRKEEDTFPTLYLCNTKKDLISLAKNTHFKIDDLFSVEGRPEYLRITPITYPIGIVYEKIVNSSNLFENFRSIIIVNLIKN